MQSRRGARMGQAGALAAAPAAPDAAVSVVEAAYSVAPLPPGSPGVMPGMAAAGELQAELAKASPPHEPAAARA